MHRYGPASPPMTLPGRELGVVGRTDVLQQVTNRPSCRHHALRQPAAKRSRQHDLLAVRCGSLPERMHTVHKVRYCYGVLNVVIEGLACPRRNRRRRRFSCSLVCGSLSCCAPAWRCRRSLLQ